MLASTAAAVAAHGTTGTWLDEIVQFGVPLLLFVILYFWSSRKEKAKRGGAKRADTKKK